MSDSAAKINQQACAWIAKLNGEPSAADLQQLHQWMARSPVHHAEIRQLAKLWGDLDVLNELAVVQNPIAHAAAKANRLFKLPSWGWPTQIATAMVMVTLISVVSLLGMDKTSYSTAIGKQQLITLNDGSTVLLNTNSQIKVDYSDQARNITLVKGQAHFDVMPNPNQPFNVYAGTGLVKAVGTAFSVYLQPEIIEVTVTEGTVELSALDQPAPLTPSVPDSPMLAEAKVTKLTLLDAGQNAHMNQSSKSIQHLETVDAAAIMQKLAWHQGLLRFSGDPLVEVVAEVSRYTDLKIVIRDPAIRDLRIGGFFKVGETDKMFQALETSFGVRVEHKGNNVVHLMVVVPEPTQQQ